MEKYIKDINELKLHKLFNSGSCSEIYRVSSDILFKLFNNEYRDLRDAINLEFLETIRTISSIDDLNFVSKAIDIYRSDYQLYGYTMKEIDALGLDALPVDTLVLDLLLGFENLKFDIRKLADNYVKTEDIGGDNILYNKNMFLLDLDLSLVDKNYIPDELYSLTRRSVFRCLFNKITDCSFNDNVLNDDYFEYSKKLIDTTANMIGYYPKTIETFKKAYQKVNKKTIV